MKSILLIGLGNFGILLAKELSSLGHQIMAIDKDEKNVNQALQYVTNAEIGDSTDEMFLSSLGVNNYDVCIVAIGNDFQSSLITANFLKEHGARLVIARADREVQAKFLLRNGADHVVNPEKQLARWTAIRYTSNHILDFIELDPSHAIFEVSVPAEWIGKTVSDIGIRKKYGINIMGMKSDNTMDTNITPDTIFTESKTLLVLGEYKSVQKCFRL
jgi:trk system potassium uptake protein TrkA